ncbi:hypothetical protein JAAARDRAFT_36584 [Jaapia argillacea MUCL 33604]|uniref:Uncharacterized protein n=1 Tax=Jaapia argillacea MUCL 33604 TaxID=933084 RepID=A0A067PNS8_9AGAM|nr:hypothetical protein JAAARDRAFT_36584 [Jaapia argillacea MUCL 33604]
MSSTTPQGEGDIDDGWEVVHKGAWWSTSYRSIAWPPPEGLKRLISQSRAAYSKLSLLLSPRQKHEDPDTETDRETATRHMDKEQEVAVDLELNKDLVGVKDAEQVLKLYEAIVGFYDIDDDESVAVDAEPHSVRASFEDEIEAVDPSVLRKRWVEQVDEALGGILTLLFEDQLPIPPSEDTVEETLRNSSFSSLWDLSLTPPSSPRQSPSRTKWQDLSSSSTSLDSPSSIIDLTDSSDTSIDSLPPRTPPQRKLYADIVVDLAEEARAAYHKRRGIRIFTPSPPKPLNASASSFVPASSTPFTFSFPTLNDPPSPSWPSSTSPSPSSLNDFHFPSLTPSTSASRSNKDSSSSSSSTRASSLPPTLQKDENGFYTQVPIATSSTSLPTAASSEASPKRHASLSSFPSFLMDEVDKTPKKSLRTRDLVDQMKSTPAKGGRSRKSRNKSLQIDLDDPIEVVFTGDEDGEVVVDVDGDGWIRERGDDADGKTKRTRELVAALGAKSKGGSAVKGTSEKKDKATLMKKGSSSKDGDSGLPKPSARARSPKKPPLASHGSGSGSDKHTKPTHTKRDSTIKEDGWIDGPSIPHAQPSHRTPNVNYPHPRHQSTASMSSIPSTPASAIATFAPPVSVPVPVPLMLVPPPYFPGIPPPPGFSPYSHPPPPPHPHFGPPGAYIQPPPSMYMGVYPSGPFASPLSPQYNGLGAAGAGNLYSDMSSLSSKVITGAAGIRHVPW